MKCAFNINQLLTEFAKADGVERHGLLLLRPGQVEPDEEDRRLVVVRLQQVGRVGRRVGVVLPAERAVVGDLRDHGLHLVDLVATHARLHKVRDDLVQLLILDVRGQPRLLLHDRLDREVVHGLDGVLALRARVPAALGRGELEARGSEVEVGRLARGPHAGGDLAEAAVDELLELLEGVDVALGVDAAEDAVDVGPGGGVEVEDEVLVGVALLRDAQVGLADDIPIRLN